MELWFCLDCSQTGPLNRQGKCGAMVGNGVTLKLLAEAGASAFDLRYLKEEAKLGGRIAESVR